MSGVRTRLQPLALPSLLIAAALAVRLPTLDQPLIEAHAFRQTQTAFTARAFIERGIHLFDPEVPVFGEPWRVPFEMPIFQAIATLPANLGLSLDVSLRATSLAGFAATAALLWALASYVTASRTAAFATVAFFSFSPLALLWSRASLMEYLATAGSVGFVLAAIKWWDSRRPWLAVVAGACFVLAMLVKVTTAAFWVIPVAGWVLKDGGWRRPREFMHPGFVAIAGPGLVATALWTRHADHVKAASPATKWLTSSALGEWNFGTLAQRTQAANWTTVFDRVEQFVVGNYVWIVLAVLAIALCRWRLFWASIAVTALLPIGVFFNLYVVHDYYLAAISPAVALLMGAGAGAVAARSRRPPIALVALVVGWMVTTLVTTSSYWRAAYREIDLATTGPQLPLQIRDHTEPSDRVVVVGFDWDPQWLYYAERRGVMLVDDTKTGHPTEAVVEAARRRDYRAFVAADPANNPVHWVSRWPWFGSVTANLYRLDDAATGVSKAPVVGTSDAEAISTVRRAGTVVGRDTELACGPGSTPLMLPDAGTVWLRFAPIADVRVRISAGNDVAPLPPVELMAVRQSEAAPRQVSCTGAASVTILEVLRGPELETIQ